MDFGYHPWNHVSSQDELSEHLKTLWMEHNIKQHESNWSDREYRKYVMSVDPADNELVFKQDGWC